MGKMKPKCPKHKVCSYAGERERTHLGKGQNRESDYIKMKDFCFMKDDT